MSKARIVSGIILMLTVAFFVYFSGSKSDIAPKEVVQQVATSGEFRAFEDVRTVAPISEVDQIYGNPNAIITIYEYSDFECPWCKKFSKTSKAVVDMFRGNVNTVFRQFPLASHDPLATRQATASECAAKLGGQEMFWTYHDKVFETTTSNGNGMLESQLYTIAADFGLNKDEFAQCMSSGEFAQKIADDIASGIAAGVTGTPGIVMKNNKTGELKVMSGWVPIESIQAMVIDLLK